MRLIRLLCGPLFIFAVPIHWGTLFPLVMHRVRPDALHDPPRIFARCASRIAPGTRVEILDPGSRIELG
ncbi:MAG: hypothetical protein ACKOTA_08805 [Solirubrobacterales bacterium]